MRECEGTERKYYTVSEAVQRCGVPSHVLRYWEEELGLAIERTAQGHRVYREEDLTVFGKVKELKEKGIQLKAIRLLLEDSEEGQWLGMFLEKEAAADENAGVNGCESEKYTDCERGGDREECVNGEEDTDYEIIPASEANNYQRFEEMLRSLIGEVVAEQNEKLEHMLSERLHEEMEDLYIQLQQEETRREAATTEEKMACAVRKEGILGRIRRTLRM
ncbi:MAG: helix-turn-helix domain-containing protein [Lachnospiraceae bacterium]|nr:helix-turn-helix domain-containing protein [Lachnospiraceae bacterium]